MRKKQKKIFCLLCAEEKGMLVGFPSRTESPWNRLNVPSRIEHLKNCHFIDADLTNYEQYFVHDIQEVIDYLKRKVEK